MQSCSGLKIVIVNPFSFCKCQTELEGPYEYAAFALSRDNRMGDSNAMVCTSDNVEMYWTYVQGFSRGADKLADPYLGISDFGVIPVLELKKIPRVNESTGGKKRGREAENEREMLEEKRDEKANTKDSTVMVCPSS